MLNTELAQLLRAAATRLDAIGNTTSTPTLEAPPSAAPASAPNRSESPAPPGTQRGLCTFWEVGLTLKGRPKGRLGLQWRENGQVKREFFSTYDEKLLARIDPVPKGVPVDVTLKQWNDTFVIEDVVVRRDREVA